MADSRGQELEGTELGVRVSRLALENKGDALLAISGQQEMHTQGIKINNEQSQKQRKDSRKKNQLVYLEESDLQKHNGNEGFYTQSNWIIQRARLRTRTAGVAQWATIQTDASKDGWGATLRSQHVKKRIILQEAQLEGIRVLTDNIVAMFNLNKGRVALSLANLVNSILLLAEQQGWKVEAQHIQGIMNKEPDSLSRLDRSGDYAISKDILHTAMMKLKVEITMDAFATRINRQHRKFCSITKDIWAMLRDGLSISWEKQTPLFHPPIPLLLSTIRKVKEDGVKTAVIIASKWPGQYWYTELLEITVQMIRLGQSKQVLIPGFIEPGERLFRFLLEDYGLKQEVVQRIVEAWHGQWIRHVFALTFVVKYLEQNKQKWNELRILEQSSVFLANFISDQMEKDASDNSLMSYRGELAEFLPFIGYQEEEVHNKLVAQLMKPVLMKSRHKNREIEQ
ncbi:MAG: hypothetical protein EZS28_010987 [Streblomastix strix]|uniref:Uncharacterized protein n=1 Tax=Streblomastix strix TaxID=222440 RepID=A0A5J4WES4_9EUKA|nr:MAG: hypothetical protein EZS28_010987 [Streblomastix strix]